MVSEILSISCQFCPASIFDKGLLLPRPEVIPFRLTPNMIDAFGPTGAKGLYTGALIEATRTIRCNSDVLLAVLEAFIKDPVIQGSKSKKTKEGRDVRGAEASIAKIRDRLEGQYNLRNPNKLKGKNASKVPDKAYEAKLSVEGQVQKMIAEATSLENLVQVYVGWMVRVELHYLVWIIFVVLTSCFLISFKPWV